MLFGRYPPQDIINSEMGDLGWFDSESYGLTWKVRGFCEDLSNPEVFDEVNVYGDIQGSNIYGMYYGMYSYGHQAGVWTNNVMHDNILYGYVTLLSSSSREALAHYHSILRHL